MNSEQRVPAFAMVICVALVFAHWFEVIPPVLAASLGAGICLFYAVKFAGSSKD